MNYNHDAVFNRRVIIWQSQDSIDIPKYGQKTGLAQYYKQIDHIATNQNIHIFKELSEFWDKEWKNESYRNLEITEEAKINLF